MSDLSSRIAGLSPEKRALLALQLKQRRGAAASQASIPQRSDLSVYPLSFAQQRIWFLSQIEPDSPFYNISAAVMLEGELDLTALETSLNTVIRRHEVLRATFQTRQGEPVQLIAPELRLNLAAIDLQHLSPGEQEEEVQRRAAAEVATPVDISRGAVIRAGVLRLNPVKHVLLISMHHMVSDGWSLGIFTHEIAQSYRAYTHGEADPLPELAIQYADYAQWQHDWLKGEVLEKQLGYWEEQLKNAPSILDLPTDRPRPAVQSYAGGRVEFTVPAETTAALQSFCRRQGVTPFMALLAAYQALLSRYSGQEDICVGTPHANRGRAEIEPLIGFFVNTLVMRADLSARPSFANLVQQVRERTLEAQNNADLPFDLLVDRLQIPRDPAVSPLFQTVFALQDKIDDPLELPGIQASILPVYTPAAKFDLVFTLEKSVNGLSGYIEYKTDLFNRETIERMTGHYTMLLSAALANPERAVSELPLLTPAEYQRMLVEWNDNAQPFPGEFCLQQLFEMQAGHSPQAEAVFFEGQRLSYGELNERANRLAHWLRKKNIGPEALVGICIERSIDMIPAILGVLKAGGAYLPLDPNYPTERLGFMIADSGAKLLLTHRPLREHLPETAAEIVYLEEHPEADEPSENLPCQSTPSNLAYVIYTSGSTGKPKGTLLEHRSVVNFVYAFAKKLNVTASTRFLQFFSFGFDGSVAEIFCPLINGGAVYLITQEIMLSGAGLAHFIHNHQVTSALMPPSILSVLPVEELDSLQWLASGGEKLPAELANRLAAGRHFFNAYGPTETTVGPTIYPFEGGCPEYQNAPIGKALPNIRLYILDQNLQPAPVGVPGELHIGGVCLARGYLNRPELTEAKFIPDPFSPVPGARMYRTGDLCRYHADGNVEYIGRIDRQVKLRGFRIELGEIEAALVQHPAIQAAAVMMREDSGNPEARYIAAYLTTQPDEAQPAQAELKNFLKASLPEYMCPSVFVFLESFPLTTNSKIDWKALPTPERTQSDLGEAYEAPRTPLEQYLAQKWMEVIAIDRVGVNDNYFELGGNSIQAAVIINRIQEETGEPVQVRALFLSPSVAGLAAYIEQHHPALAARFDEPQQAQSEAAIEETAIPASPRGEELALSFAQARLWFLDKLEPDNPFYNISTAARLSGKLDVAVLEKSLNEIVRRHETLRTSFISREGVGRQVIAPELTVNIPLIDLSGVEPAERDEQVKQHIAAEAQRVFDLTRLPLMRTALIKTAEQEHIIVLTMHHIISDGWSMGVFVRELAALYTAYSQAQLSPLPELKIQYYDYAAWQREQLQSEILQSQVDFWIKSLDGIPALLELPTDHPRPAMQTYNGRIYEFALPVETTRRLIELGQRRGASGFMTLLAVFQTLLARYSGQEDICVGTPAANRTRHEIEPLIGFFVNTLVLRGDLSGDPSFSQLLERTRESLAGAFANQDVPFELLVERLHPERNLSHSPLFQVMFSFESDQLAGFQLPGLTLSLLPMDTGTSKFDLTLNIVQSQDSFTGQIEYNTDLFEAETIRRMGNHFTRLIEKLAKEPERPLSEIDLLSVQERQQAIYGWNQTRADYNLDQPIHRLFEAQVQRSPDALAVSFKGQTLTYAELNRRANRLARHLIHLGAGAETIIGLSLERSLEMIVGLLGILKSGAAYLPMDPVYPSERLAFMLEDTGATIVLTQAHLAGRLPDGCRKVVLESGAVGFDEESSEDCAAAATAENAAYIIYTSGSTGTPKGVVVTHRNAANHNQYAARAFGLTPADRVLQFATINFDTAVEEIFPTLISGATLILRPEQELSTGAQLMQLIREENLTVLDFPTAYWHEWVRQLSDHPAALPPSLRLVVVGGEKALPERYGQWRQIAGERVAWLNTYGPTEGTIIATLYRPAPGQALPDGRLPIGKPIANDRIYLLDSHRQPVPVGLPGEVYIAGEGVARGYLNRPEQTAERFMADPFVPGARMYRSGDLGRYLADGNIEYLGRIDHQIKVRGFRIEPGEIESALRTHPAIEDAVVLAREDLPGVRRLVAYIVARNGQRVEDLRGFLKERLPEYMIPAAFVPLDALPLSPSGKVDRKALPAPDFSRPELDSCFAAPETPNEKTLAEIWSQVLGIQKVGIHDNFFDLGGDSILSIQVIARANAAGLRLSPRHLFEAQTIAQLAALAGEAGQSAVDQGAVSGPAALTPIQRWFFELDLPERNHWNQSILLETTTAIDRAALEKALAALAEHHDMLRARYNHDGSGWQQRIEEPGETLPLDWIDLSSVSDSQVRDEIERECARLQSGLDITRGPLARAGYFDLGSRRGGRLFLTIHHLVVDGVSWRILLEDLQNGYLQAASGAALHLPDKTSSYAVWAGGLEQYAQTTEALDEMDTWLGEPGAGILPLPVDFACETPSEASSATLSQTFSVEETSALLGGIPAASHSEPNEELLAALGMALRHWSGRQAFLIELEGHGREDVLNGIDLTRTVGWFTAIFPFRLDLAAKEDPAEALSQVKAHLRRIPKHGTGFSLLRYLYRDPQVRQKLAGLPQGEISFNYLGRVSSDMEAGALFRMSREPVNAEHDPLSPLLHRLTISGLVYDNRLKVDWIFSTEQYRPATIQKLMAEFQNAVRALIARCGELSADGFMPVDLSGADLSQGDLDNLIDEIGEAF